MELKSYRQLFPSGNIEYIAHCNFQNTTTIIIDSTNKNTAVSLSKILSDAVTFDRDRGELFEMDSLYDGGLGDTEEDVGEVSFATNASSEGRTRMVTSRSRDNLAI